jgi:uncharacterized protein
MTSDTARALCLECGLCCNGVIFARGQLQPEDNPERLQELGLALLPPGRDRKSQPREFKQPCKAFDGCRCNIYTERPKYCRDFECLLLKSFQSGQTEPDAALGIIRRARRRVEKVKQLLHRLGDSDEHVPLKRRFEATRKRLEGGHGDAETAAVFGELTLALHDLNVLLSERFYSE